MKRRKTKTRRADITIPLLQASEKVNTISVKAVPEKFIDPMKEDLKSAESTQGVLTCCDRRESGSFVDVCKSWRQEGPHNLSGWMDAHVNSYLNEGTPSTVIYGSQNTDSNNAASKLCSRENEFRVYTKGFNSQIASSHLEVDKVNRTQSFNVAASMESTEVSLQRLIVMHESKKVSEASTLPSSSDSKTTARQHPPQSVWGGIEPNETSYSNKFVDLESIMCSLDEQSNVPANAHDQLTNPDEDGRMPLFSDTRTPPQPPLHEAAQSESRMKSLAPSHTGPTTPFSWPAHLPPTTQRAPPPESVACDGLSSSGSLYTTHPWRSMASPAPTHARPTLEGLREALDAHASRHGPLPPAESVSSAAVQSKLMRELIGSDEDSECDLSPMEVTTVSNENHGPEPLLRFGASSAGGGNAMHTNASSLSHAAEGFFAVPEKATRRGRWGTYPPAVMSPPFFNPQPQVSSNDTIENLMSLLISDE